MSSRRLALVTGATSGIGAAFARRLAADGYDLVLVARDARAPGRRTADAAAAARRPSRCRRTCPPTRAARRSRSGWPTAPVDLLVNNAGMTPQPSFLRSTWRTRARLLRLNVHAVMRLTHAALPVMAERGHGAVINVSSVAGFGAAMPGSTYSGEQGVGDQLQRVRRRSRRGRSASG